MIICCSIVVLHLYVYLIEAMYVCLENLTVWLLGTEIDIVSS